MMTKPPVDNLGYKALNAHIVDSYQSPSSRITARRSIGAFGSVSENHPDRNLTCSSSNRYFRKVFSTSPRGIFSRSSGSSRKYQIASSKSFSGSGFGKPSNE